jgi:hypothetical protein
MASTAATLSRWERDSQVLDRESASLSRRLIAIGVISSKPNGGQAARKAFGATLWKPGFGWRFHTPSPSRVADTFPIIK